MDNFIADPSLEDLSTEKMRWMLKFWNDLRGARAMPARADFSPADMVPMLPFVTLTDVERDPLRFKARLVGTGIVAESGVDPTGKYYEELRNSDKLIERSTWVAENRQTYFARDLPLDWASLDFNSYSALVMPLSSDGDHVDMMLGFVDFD